MKFSLLFLLLCCTALAADAQSGSEQWLLDNTIKGKTFQEHLAAGSNDLRDRNYKPALEHYLDARKLMERDTSNVHRDYWISLWAAGADAAWGAGNLKLSQEFSDNAVRHNPEPLPVLDEKIKKLLAEGIKDLFIFHTFSYGTGASICVGCGCYSRYDRHLFWLKGDSLYIQCFDECTENEVMAFTGGKLAAFYRENIAAVIRERIEKHGSEGHHIEQYRFKFYTPDLGAWEKNFNIDNLKAPGTQGNPAIYQSNINTRLSRLLPLVLEEYGKYRKVLDSIRSSSLITWKDTVLVNDVAVQGTVKPSHADRTNYGSEYARLLKLKNKVWLAVYTVARNKGYEADPEGGLNLEIARSADNGRSWKVISSVSDPGRDLDNAELTLLKDGSVMLACRSVRWQESYRLPVYKSRNKGVSWERLSLIDANEGKAGELGKPDKGVYEPHILEMENGDLAVMYANEKHVTDGVFDMHPNEKHLTDVMSYSQLIAQKISKDGGRTWGKENWAAYTPGRKDSRPGMPVWTKMKNGDYILVYEVCGPENCDVYYKISKDGLNWPAESTRLMFASALSGESFYGYPNGGPFILSLTDGRLVLTANSGEVSISGDYGRSWYRVADPRELKAAYKQDWTQFIWSSLYQLGPDEIGALSSVKRAAGGHNIQMRIGKLNLK